MKVQGTKWIAALSALILVGGIAVTATANVNAKTYFACLKDGALSNVGQEAAKCPPGARRISLNSQGGVGATGPAGAAGASGSNGANGLSEGFISTGMMLIPAQNPASDNVVRSVGYGESVSTQISSLEAGKYSGSLTINYLFPNSSALGISVFCNLSTDDYNYGSNFIYLRSSNPGLLGDSGSATLAFDLAANAKPIIVCVNQMDGSDSFPVFFTLELTKVNTLTALPNETLIQGSNETQG